MVEQVQVTSTKLRTFTKALTYEMPMIVLDALAAAVIGLVFFNLTIVKTLMVFTGATIAEKVFHMVWYYSNDRLWKRVSWGKIIREESE